MFGNKKSVNNCYVKKCFLLLIVAFCSSLMVGCEGNSTINPYVKLKINYCNSKLVSNFVVSEIEEVLIGVILTDKTTLTEDKIKTLCDSVLTKWGVSEEVVVIIYNFELIELTIGESIEFCVLEEKIMLPIDGLY